MIIFFPEKGVENRAAFVDQDPIGHLDSVVETFVRGDVEKRLARPGLGIRRPKD